MSLKQEVTQERLKLLLTYNPYAGNFIWNSVRGRNCDGREAGSITGDGHRRISIDGKTYVDSRLAVLFMTGSFPAKGLEVDHINTLKQDCSWSNLRICTKSQNQHNQNLPCNNTSGIKGVSYAKHVSKWRAAIAYKGKTQVLGYYDSVEEAEAAVKAARLELHKEFTNHGGPSLPTIGDLL